MTPAAALRPGLDERSRGARRARGRYGQAPRRPGRPAARLGPLGRAGLDARDDGHGPQPRAERRGRRGPRRADRQRAFRLGLATAASCRCTANVVLGVAGDVLRGAICSDLKERPRRQSRHRSRRRRLSQELVRSSCEIFRARPGSQFPEDPREQLAGAIPAVFASWNTPRATTTGGTSDISDEPGHGGQRAADGLRQHGRRLRHGRRLHPRPLHRRARALRRVPPERAGRGRRRRASARPSRSASSRQRCRRRTASWSRRSAKLETHYHDMQDVEFTIEQGRLYILQTRPASGPRRRRCGSPSTWSPRA